MELTRFFFQFTESMADHGESAQLVLNLSNQKPTHPKKKFTDNLIPTKVGAPGRPGKDSVEGDPVWITDGCYGAPQFVDFSLMNPNSLAYFDYEYGPFFYGLGYLRVDQKTGKFDFVWNPEENPFKEIKAEKGTMILMHTTSHSAYDATSTESNGVKIDGFVYSNFM